MLEISDQEVLEWYTAKDFIVGKPLTILGRTFFIYDCDPFTRQYYRDKFGMPDLPRIDVSKHEPPPVKQVNGIGVPSVIRKKNDVETGGKNSIKTVDFYMIEAHKRGNTKSPSPYENTRGLVIIKKIERQ